MGLMLNLITRSIVLRTWQNILLSSNLRQTFRIQSFLSKGSTMVTRDLHLTILEVPRVKWAQHLPHTLSQRRRCHRKTLKLLSWLTKTRRNSNKWNLRSLNPQSHLNLLLLKDQKLNRIELWSMKEDNLSHQVSCWTQLPLMQNLESSTHQQY